MRKIKYSGPMPRVTVWRVGRFERGVPVEVTDENAVMLLREPGFYEVKSETRPDIEKPKKGGKE